MTNERKIYSLTQLNTSLEKHFWDNFSQRDFWITAELIKINEKRGHFYLEIADSVDDQTTARGFATIWASAYTKIVENIGLKELQSILQPGNKILFNINIEYHKIYGLSLRVRDVDPNYSYGEIERKRQEVIKRLKKEGIFDKQKALHLPPIIKRIALIGSPNTSGYRDFLNELFNNHEFNNFTIKEFPVRVQGEAAVHDIVEAIKEANHYDAEVIVLLRGGGSKMDLALFDDYKIAEAICLSKLPVITGIGHETDVVVADLVARQHHITPTAVAVHIHYAISSFREIMRELYDKMIQLASGTLNEGKEEFTMYSNYLSHYTRELIHFWKNTFKDLEFEILQKGRTVLYAGKDKLSYLSHNLSSHLQGLVHQEANSLDRFKERLLNYSLQTIEREKEINLNQTLSKVKWMSQQVIERERIITKNQEELLGLLNPLKILSAGYTISTINYVDVKDIKTINEGDVMQTLSSNTLITSVIKQSKKIEDGDN